MELQRALDDIADIRRQMSFARQCRGFRAATTMFTGVAAILAGAWQAWQSPDPSGFVELWVGVAVACIGVCAVELVWRYRRCESESQQELTREAVAAFFPFVLVGGLMALAVWQFAAEALWMLPGLWQILFGLGLYSIRRLFPGPLVAVAAFYVLCGLASLSGLAPRFSPWSMGVPFGVGQAATALILYWYLERHHAA